eukprot:NODE_4611_length_643_cov_64.818182_g3953_i0.p1 GENE.NODE_4611_length_643_cov_64.818182_g3953_i0~~NODE_4611_length_643_cov_64.818182_g3953_i0.p1  ORF type:complete len:197 (+),score=51.16 NODE_4611_length_643_cov_64.818182_g3953_i0:35-592(+)
MVKYCRKSANPEKSAQAKVDDLRAHYKNTYETAKAVKGLKIKRAINYYEQVLEKKAIIPFRRHLGGIGRNTQAKQHKCVFGRWPEKSVTKMLSLLKNLLSNAESKGLDTDRCVITNVVVQRAAQGRRRTYRAHGRISPYKSSNCHVQFYLSEKAEGVKKTGDKIGVRLTKRQAAQQRLAIGGGSS